MGLTCVQKRNISTLVLRIGLGSLFLISWVNKLGNPAAVYAQVASSHILPPPLDLVYATALPYWELFFGVFFLLGLGTRMTSIAALLTLLSYTIYQAMPASQARLGPLGPAMVSHNITFMLACAGVFIGGAGAYSLDALIAARPKLVRGLSAVIGDPLLEGR